MKSKLIHKDFKLQGIPFTSNGIMEYLKEKKDYYNFLKSWFDHKDYILTKTSGSTGNPKEIKLKKLDLIESSKLTARYFDLKVGDKVINCLPIKYIAGKMMLVRSLVLGLDLYIFPVTSSPISDLKNNYMMIAFTPLQLENSLPYISKIKNVLIGGSSVNENLKQRTLNVTSNVFETYGMTETVTHIAVRNLSMGEHEFTTLPGIAISERHGCLLIEPAHLSIDFIQTNDIVELITKNKFILIGRKDFIINSGGVKINPELVEKKLRKYLNIDFVVSSIDDDKFGEIVVLVFKKNIPHDYQKAFVDLDKYEVPKLNLVLENFPENNGKINRIKIKQLINQRKV